MVGVLVSDRALCGACAAALAAIWTEIKQTHITRVMKGKGMALRNLAFTRYCYYQYCIVYNSMQTEGRKASRILSNNRAILLHQGGQCRWAGGMKGWLIRAQQFRINEYLVKANAQRMCSPDRNKTNE